MSLTMNQYWIVVVVLLIISTLVGFVIAKWGVKSTETKTILLYCLGGIIVGGIVCAILYYIPNFVQTEKKAAQYAPPVTVNINGVPETLITAESYLMEMKGMNNTIGR